MSKSDWRTAFIAGIVLIGSFAIGGFILGSQLGHQEGQRDAKTQEYARHAADEIENTCLGLGGDAEVKCIVDVIEATNSHERAEDDLIAQKNMGRWALYMLLATLVMAIITAFGVYYVWQTLLATQHMAKDTKEIGNSQLRPWMLSNGVEKSFSDSAVHNNQPVGKAIVFAMSWKSAGQSPATAATIFSDFRVVLSGADVPTFKPESAVERGDSPRLGKGNIAPNGIAYGHGLGIWGQDLVNFLEGTHEVIIFSRVEYGSAFSKEEAWHTDATYRLIVNGAKKDKSGATIPNIEELVDGYQNSIT